MSKPTPAQFDKASADVAFSYAPPILECQKCGWPHADGYVCRYCGDENPKMASEKAPQEVKTYRDKAKCPKGHKFAIVRRSASAGKTVSTFCQTCSRMYQIKAGPLPAPKGSK